MRGRDREHTLALVLSGCEVLASCRSKANSLPASPQGAKEAPWHHKYGHSKGESSFSWVVDRLGSVV